MLRRIILVSCFSVALLVSSRLESNAQQTPLFIEYLKGKDGNIAVGKKMVVADTLFFKQTGTGRISFNSVANTIRLSIDESSGLVLPDSFTLAVTYKVRFVNKNRSIDSFSNKQLQIAYYKNKPGKSSDVFSFSNAYRTDIEITGVQVQYANPTTILPQVFMQGMMLSGTAVAMNCSSDMVSDLRLVDVTTDANGNTVNVKDYTGELIANWGSLPSATEYDLEWTYIDKAALDAGIYNEPGYEQYFTGNSTRVTTRENSYTIPLLYDGDGFLYARVRGAQYLVDGTRRYTAWTYTSASNAVAKYDYTGHMPRLNWQTTTSFAEDGKRKTVVQYFDGSLMGRQTVTKDNSTQTTVVAETLYDLQGRPVISILPSPTMDKLIKYSPLFNTAVSSSLNTPVEYDKTLYDPENDAPNSGQTAAPAMSTSSGTAQYYSPDNPKAAEGINQYIPNANGYAFSETRYMPDNTGRVQAQSGVGKAFQLGSGHETQYFYSTPLQTELDALFGTEAGIWSHYQKNMVRDANGQLSVSYIDMHGRTVATALAGSTPKGLAPLSSSIDPLQVQTDALLNTTNNRISGNSLVSQSSLMVQASGDHRFVYNFTPPVLQHVNKNGVTNCYAPVYRLTITLVNTSDTTVPLVLADTTNYVPGNNAITCAPGAFAVDKTLQNLVVGSYTVNKVLTVIDSVAVYYRDSVFIPLNQKSTEEIRTLTSQNIKASRNCSLPVSTEAANSVNDYWNLLYADLSPTSGQFAVRKEVNPISGNLESPPAYTGFSIFDISGNNNFPYYEFPVNQALGQYAFQYLNEKGLPDSVSVFREGGEVLLPPDKLTEEEFTRHFRASWAQSLAYMHPEYKRMEAFEQLAASHQWEDAFRAVNNYSQALAKGYLNPTNNTLLVPAKNFPGTVDPLITLLPAYKTPLEQKMLSYFNTDPVLKDANIWALAGGNIACPGDTASFACLVTYNNNPFPASLCSAELDEAWRNFRDLYLNARAVLVNQYLQNCDGCIITRTLSANASLLFPEYQQEPIIYNKERKENVASNVLLMIDENCRANAQEWMESLGPCNYTQAQQQALTVLLVNVCKEGGDIRHLNGSSTVKAGSGYVHKSFAEALAAFNSANGISLQTCSGYLISNPAPYSSSTTLTGGTRYINSKPDSCDCAQVNRLYGQYQQLGTAYANFSTFLLKQYQTTISVPAADSLYALCSGAITCKFIPNPLPLPNSMQCSFVESSCVNCTLVKQQHQEFIGLFGFEPDAANDSTEDQRRKNIIYGNYMNEKIGFSKTYLDYLVFLESCNQVVAPEPESLIRNETSDSLRLLVSDFLIDFNTGFIDTLPGVVPSFVEYYNNREGTAWNFTEIKSNFKTITGLSLNLFEQDDCVKEQNSIKNYDWTNSVAGLGFTFISMKPTPDRGNLIFFRSNYFSEVQTDPLSLLIVKTDEKGHRLWQKEALDYFYDPIVVVNKDGGFSLLDKRGYYGYINISKFNRHGDVVWQTQLDVQTGLEPISGKELSDGGLLLWINNASTGLRVLKIHSNGAVAWNKLSVNTDTSILVAQLVSVTERGEKIQLFSRGGELVNLNKTTGDVISVKKLFFPGFNYISQAVRTPEGFLLEANSLLGRGGDLGDRKVFIRLDSALSIVSASEYNDSSHFPQAIQILPINDSSWVVAYRSGNNADAILSHFYNGVEVKWHNLHQNNTPLDWNNKRGNSIYKSGNNSVTYTEAYGFCGDDCFHGANLLKIDIQTGKSCNAIAAIKPTYSPISASQTDTLVTFQNQSAAVTYLQAITYNSESFTLPDYTLVCSSSLNTTCASSSDTLTLCNTSPFTILEELGIAEDNTPCGDTTGTIEMVSTTLVQYQTDSLAGVFDQLYYKKALGAGALESFNLIKRPSEYHYTLYYYDQAGNLVKTVPPEGVTPNRDPQWLAQVAQKRLLDQEQIIQHGLPTIYRYNGLNQVVQQSTPDAGISNFWYDRLGRLAISQNDKQKSFTPVTPGITGNHYSYTVYEPVLGRITEVGEKTQPTPMTSAISRNPSALTQWLYFNNAAGNYDPEQVTYTMYDQVSGITSSIVTNTAASTFKQEGYLMRNRVSNTRFYNKVPTIAVTDATSGLVTYQPKFDHVIPFYNTATYYSYDIHGNVDKLLNDYGTSQKATTRNFMNLAGNNRFKLMAYYYDLISGKVNQLHYQPGEADQFFHRYEYDAENRIMRVFTTDSKENIGIESLEEQEAQYDYYKHGPLARTVLGQQKVQGMDYAYTLQGWLKGVNSSGASYSIDMGRDGTTDLLKKDIARDAYAFSLHYYNGGNSAAYAAADYSAINSNQNPFPGHKAFIPTGEYKELFNGNISSMTVSIPKLGQNGGVSTVLYNYKYDQLNRIVGMDAWKGFDATNNSWANIITTSDYRERIAYDANGNILSYLRNGSSANGKPLGMDNLQYHYNKDASGKLLNNKLRHVKDDLALAGNYTEDIDSQNDDNYTYDGIGNLVKDNAEKIANIEWSVYGKILSISKEASVVTGVVQRIEYSYDAAGNRIAKKVYSNNNNTEYRVANTGYVRDASGNTMAVYTSEDIVKKNNINNTTTQGGLVLQEQHLYGSSRLGIYNRNMPIGNTAITTSPIGLLGNGISGNLVRGNKFFELSNHLGNVLVTVSDKKIGVDANNDGTIDYYNADVVTANDYAPFGMALVGRTFDAGKYRYGFNGKENDKETTTQDYGMRIYDPQLGRFLSVDPLTSGYPMLTPYQFASNRPIDGIDIDGGEYLTYNIIISRQTGNVLLKKAEWVNPKQHNAHGKLGQGVQYNITVYDEKHKLNTNYNYSFVGRNDNQYIMFVGHIYTEYGNYMGATGLFTVGKDGNFTKEYNYDIDAVDAVDNFAKLHDIGYDKLFAIGATGLFDDWGTTPVDEAALNGWIDFRNKYKVGDVDPYNSQKVTKPQREAAWRGLRLFSYVVNDKKMSIAKFMEKNYGSNWKPGKGISRIEHYYKKFLETYLTKDDKGNWIRQKGMWNQDSKGNYTTPKTPEQISNEKKTD
jgi:RHS repeat-associated protein